MTEEMSDRPAATQSLYMTGYRPSDIVLQSINAQFSQDAAQIGIGNLVVDLISDKATFELISCTPGTRESLSKKNRS